MQLRVEKADIWPKWGGRI